MKLKTSKRTRKSHDLPILATAKSSRQTRLAELLITRPNWPILKLAEELGVNRNTITTDIREIKKEWQMLRTDAFENHLQEELVRLGKMEEELWEVWAQERRNASMQTPVRIEVMDRIMKIHDKRVNLLGLNAPIKFDIKGLIGIAAKQFDIPQDELLQDVEQITGILNERQGHKLGSAQLP